MFRLRDVEAFGRGLKMRGNGEKRDDLKGMLELDQGWKANVNKKRC